MNSWKLKAGSESESIKFLFESSKPSKSIMEMKGIEIKDSTEDGNALSFDIRELIAVIGEPALVSSWQCKYLECFGDNAEKLHEISDKEQHISGEELMQIASGIYQTVDGEFEAYCDKAEKPWLVIRAIDSSSFDVITSDLEILERVRRNFQDVTDLPSYAF